MGERIIIAMSGGVDSSTAAGLLLEEGYEVVGVTMRIWDYPPEQKRQLGSCCSLDDINEARAVAHRLGIPFYLLDLRKEFEKEVIQYFISEYQKGRTPNPCILCNQKLKFESLVRYADRIGATKVATGHYASLEKKRGRTVIKRGLDRNKDQSYYLFNLDAQQRERVLFPLGKLTKEEVRKRAHDLALKVADKAESQEICFIPDNDYAAFVAARGEGRSLKGGDIVSEKGEVLGRHDGIHRYTIGQRKGLGIAWKAPLYVTRIDMEQNRVVVGEGEGLMKRSFTLRDLNWQLPPQGESIATSIQIRSRCEPAPALVRLLKNGGAEALFEEPQRAITPGQAAVFYEGDYVVGGGWVEEVTD